VTRVCLAPALKEGEECRLVFPQAPMSHGATSGLREWRFVPISLAFIIIGFPIAFGSSIPTG
jgi:hypothetical protein